MERSAQSHPVEHVDQDPLFHETKGGRGEDRDERDSQESTVKPREGTRQAGPTND